MQQQRGHTNNVFFPLLLIFAVCFAFLNLYIGQFINPRTTDYVMHTVTTNNFVDNDAKGQELHVMERNDVPSQEVHYGEHADVQKQEQLLLKESRYSTLPMYGAHKVQESLARLPDWLQDYIKWHAEERTKPDGEIKFLVITCFLGEKCGGTSDRLRALPYWLLMARLTRRVLTIHWTKPHDLSEFLVPPQGGLDWRSVPEFRGMIRHDRISKFQGNDELPFFFGGRACGDYVTVETCTIETILPRLEKEASDKQFIIMGFPGNQPHQVINDGNMFAQQFSYKDKYPELSQWAYSDIFGDIFRVMFEPVPVLSDAINKTMVSLGLQEGKFVSTHVRARYPAANMPITKNDRKKLDKGGGFVVEGRLKDYILNVVTNAITCGNILAPDLLMFFASDSHVASDLANESKVKSVSGDDTVDLVTVKRTEEPLHIDRDDGWPGSKPSDFFSGFEDLLIMGGSKCVAHGIGSFGSFGAGLIDNKCKAIHRKYNGVRVRCPNDRADRNLVSTNHTLVSILQDKVFPEM